MKKLIIAACVIGFAAVSQAALYNWKTQISAGGGGIYFAGTTTAYNKGTQAYLFLSASVEDVFDALRGGTAASAISGSLDNSAIKTTGQIAAKTTQADYITSSEDPLKAIFVTEYKDADNKRYFYISPEASVAAKTVGAATLTFLDKTSSQAAALDMSKGYQAAALDMSKGYQGAGWYTAVPEPTSGLLLLLGVAGLALRRRRA